MQSCTHLDHDFDEIIEEEEEAQKREDAPEPCDCCSSRSLDVKLCWLKLHLRHTQFPPWEFHPLAKGKCTAGECPLVDSATAPEVAEMPTLLVMVLPSEEAPRRFG